MSDQKELAFSIKILGKNGELSKLAEIEKSLKKARDQRAQLNAAYKQGLISENQLAKSTAELNLTVKALNKDKRDITRTVELETQQVKSQAGTYKSLDATLQLLKRSYKALTLEERKSAKGQELLKKIQKTDQTLKQFDNSIGQNQRNVGDYSGALQGLTGAFGSFGTQISSGIRQLQVINASIKTLTGSTEAATTATEAQTVAQTAMNTATNNGSKALRIFKIALASTGIGAIVVILGSLITALATTQEGIDAVTSVTRPLLAVFQRLLGFIQDVGLGVFRTLKEAIDNPRQALKDLGTAIVDNVINRFKALKVFAVALKDLFTGNFKEAAKGISDAALQVTTGVENATDKIGAAAKATAEATKAAIESGQQIDKLQKQIERQEINLAKTRESNLLKYNELKERANDQTRSDAERVKDLAAATNVLNQIAADDIKLIDLKIAKKKIENSLNDTDREAQLELANLEKERLAADTEAARKRATIASLRTGIVKRQIADEKKRQVEAQKATQKEVEELEKANQEIFKLGLELRDFRNDLRDEGIDKDKEAIVNKYEDEKLAIQQQIVSEQELSELKESFRAQAIQRNALLNDKLILLERAKTKELLAIEEGYQKESLENTKEINAKKIAEIDNALTLEALKLDNQRINGVLSEEEFQKKLLEVRKKYLNDKLVLIDQETAEGKIKYQELLNEIDELLKQEDPESEEGIGSFFKRLFSLSDEEKEKLKEQAIQIAGEINSAIFDLNQERRDAEFTRETRKNENEKNDAIQKLNEELESGLINEDLYRARLSKIEVAYEQDKLKREQENFEENKRLSKLQAVINGALAITNVLATSPGGPILKALEIAAVIATTALQIGVIDAQEFAEGGRVLSGERIPQSAKNIPTRASGDNVLAYVKTNEVVLNESQQAALGGDRTFAALGIQGFANGGLVQPFAPSPITISQGQGINGGMSEEQFAFLVSQVNKRIDAKFTKIGVLESDITSTQNKVAAYESETEF